MELHECFKAVSGLFRIRELNEHQKVSIEAIVCDDKDVFVSLQTGYGKWRSFTKHCQLSSMDFEANGLGTLWLLYPRCDQVNSLDHLGIKAVSLSEINSDIDLKRVEQGHFSVVYATPEALLLVERWRNVMSSDVYRRKVCAIAIDEAHVVKQW